MKTRTDVIQFYQLYYPHYTEELITAIANRIELLIEKSKQDKPEYTEEELKLIKIKKEANDKVAKRKRKKNKKNRRAAAEEEEEEDKCGEECSSEVSESSHA